MEQIAAGVGEWHRRPAAAGAPAYAVKAQNARTGPPPTMRKGGFPAGRDRCQHVPMRIVVASIPAYGHLYPMMPLALAMADAGHNLTVATGKPFVGRLPITTAFGVPEHLDIDGAIQETRRRRPDVHGLDLTVAMFADTAPLVVATLLPLFEATRPDLVVFEAMNAGAGVAAGALGIPAVAFSIGLEGYLVGRLHADAMAYHADCWISRHRVPPVENPLLAMALIDPVPPILRQPAGPPIHRLPIRPVPFSEAAGGVPAWLATPAARQRVYLTLGTVSFGAVEVLRYAVSEIAALDVDVLVAVGPDGDPTALGDVPANVHVERFVSQPEILPMMDLVIHHGGTGTVLAVLAAGLPQIILPQGADQFVNSDILCRIGAARVVRNDQHSAGTLRNSAQELLSGSSEQVIAARVQAEIAAMPAPKDVIPTLMNIAGG